MSSQPTPETLFASFVARVEAGEGVDFGAWIAGHPEHAKELRRLHAGWQLLGGTRPRTLSFFGRGERERPQPAPGLEPGKMVGDFRLVSLIGQGGMGQVWEAEQVSLRRRVAVKFVRPERVTEKQLSYFEREARAGGRLSHPGIVAIHGFGENDGIAWIAMELIEGCWTLRDFLDEAARADEIPADYDRQVASFVAQLAQGLQAAHDAGVIHRDLKPQNILITPDESPKVTDFGLARLTDETALSQTGDFAGTYFYMSPEQVAAKRMGIDHRSDIFSLGVVMYEMLTLRRPFQGDTTHQIAQQIVLRDPPDMRLARSRIPRDLAVICGKALEKDPEKRYPSMSELAADIERHLTNQPIHAKPPTRVERLVKWTKRNPTKSTSAALAALAFVVISILALRIARQKADLEQTNVALSEKTEEAETNAQLASDRAEEARANAEEAEANAAAEKRRADEVLRLSLAQDHEDLVAEAGEPWPAYPERITAYEAWITRAEKLVGEIPELEAKRAELRAQALPLTPEQERADRESHPDFAELERVKGELSCRQRALAQRREGKETEPPSVDWDAAPSDPKGLAAWARSLVDPGRTVFGKEPLGVALAERAIELASDGERAEVAAVLSQAYFAVGRDDEALGMAFMVMEESSGEAKTARELALAELEKQVEAGRSEEGLAKAAKEVSELETRAAELEARVSERRTWQFSDEVERESRARWWHNQLTGLIGELESLESGLLAETGISPDTGWSVPRRLAFARRLEAEFAPGTEFAQRWAQALPAIQAAYPGLNLKPQMGLVPLEADPASDLWEFWHVQSGAEPVRGEDGKWVIAEDTGLVFVLLPGGKFWMGAQSRDPNGRNYDGDAQYNEGPVHEVEVSAFFLSKYELAQEQWERMTGANPSRWTAETFPGWIEGVHPVEQVSWFDCMALLPTVGLELPSESQWEYGCRAGTDAPQPFGFEEFAKYANIADLSYKRAYTRVMGNESWDDGLGGHAPLGSLLPNAFGLYGVIGNVREWCLDGYDKDFYGSSPPQDPLSPFTGSGARVYRGGSFIITAIGARSAVRLVGTPSFAAHDLGVRPARVITD